MDRSIFSVDMNQGKLSIGTRVKEPHKDPERSWFMVSRVEIMAEFITF
jgi:hypothetical protein